MRWQSQMNLSTCTVHTHSFEQLPEPTNTKQSSFGFLRGDHTRLPETRGNSRFPAEPGKTRASAAEYVTSHPINQEQHCCWMSTAVCSCWIIFENTSMSQRTSAQHWKNIDLTPGSIAQYVFCPRLGLPRLVQASTDYKQCLTLENKVALPQGF